MGLNSSTFEPPDHSDAPYASGSLHRLQPWYQAYMSALFESDRAKIVERIRNAETLIVNRSRELRIGPPDPSEQRALDNALHALRALASCLKS